jgi:hypothetical protein
LALASLVWIGGDSAFGQDTCAMHPALVGNGSKSLVNLINTKHLMERGIPTARYFSWRKSIPMDSSLIPKFGA